jgi:hypothetical protein
VISFEEFLGTNGVSVVDGRIKIEDAGKISLLSWKYRVAEAKEGGLPERFKARADQVITLEFMGIERNNQDPSKYGCKYSCHKNHDAYDTIDCTVTGRLSDVWNWSIDESGEDPTSVNDTIDETLKEIDNEG